MKKFDQGISANPGGRPKKSNRAAGMCREHTEKAVEVLIKSLSSEKEDVRLKAAEQILNRGWGKPQEYVELSGDEDRPLLTKIEVVLRRADSNPGSV